MQSVSENDSTFLILKGTRVRIQFAIRQNSLQERNNICAEGNSVTNTLAIILGPVEGILVLKLEIDTRIGSFN